MCSNIKLLFTCV